MSTGPEREAEISEAVKRLDKYVFGNGQPGIEKRLTTYIDQRDAHKERNAKQEIADLERNAKQDIADLKAEHKVYEKKQDDRHEENSAILNKIKGAVILGAWGIGTLIAISGVILAMLSLWHHSGQSTISGGSNVTVSQSTGALHAR